LGLGFFFKSFCQSIFKAKPKSQVKSQKPKAKSQKSSQSQSQVKSSQSQAIGQKQIDNLGFVGRLAYKAKSKSQAKAKFMALAGLVGVKLSQPVKPKPSPKKP
jgi:hypothetical protein